MEEKTIFRVEKSKDNPFVMMDKRPLENPELSWKAKGLLGYLLSRPDNWTIRLGDLIKRSTDGEYATRQALKELEDAGHIRKEQERKENQQFAQMNYTIYEQPYRGNPHAENPQAENLDVNNNDSNKKDELIDDKEKITERTKTLVTLYEQNIGAITPLLADIIRNAAIDYPIMDWYAPAFEVAIKNNARKWNYVDAVLDGWKRNGYGWKPEKKGGNGQKSSKQQSTYDAIERVLGV